MLDKMLKHSGISSLCHFDHTNFLNLKIVLWAHSAQLLTLLYLCPIFSHYLEIHLTCDAWQAQTLHFLLANTWPLHCDYFSGQKMLCNSTAMLALKIRPIIGPPPQVGKFVWLIEKRNIIPGKRMSHWLCGTSKSSLVVLFYILERLWAMRYRE